MVTPAIGPSKGGYPGLLLIMATAAAPCVDPKMARLIRSQVPRIVTTNLPAMTESTYSLSLQPREMLLSVLRRTTMGKTVPSVKMAWVEFCVTIVERVANARFMAGMEE